MTSSWSQIPPEIAHEIAGHNANDVPTLRAMSLVSKFTRSLAIIHLFSFIHFACVEDFSRWLTMLDRTPTLGTIVKRVKFSDEVGQSWLRRHRGLEAATRLRHSAVPPIIPPLPSVRCVAWDDVHFVTNSTMVAYMALFPNVEKLHLRNKSFSALAQLINLLGACGRLRSLSFETTTVEEVESGSEMEFEAPADSDTPDLTALEELVVKDCSYPEEVDYLAHLIEDCPPNGLKTLTFGGIFRDEPCSVHATEKLLRLGALSLANLMLDPSFPYTGENIFRPPDIPS
ncbi:hypothetical protein B0H11DRAFT_480688 [Mycena galericulata]|nr:hypothetical protein B0H11DRAFT_480688 [Mycena galericulata]